MMRKMEVQSFRSLKNMEIENIRYAVISVMGPHAGESEKAIFERKIQDIHRTSEGITFWLMRSREAKPSKVQKFCSKAHADNSECYCIFIEPSSKGGAVPTKSASRATMYSKDKLKWNPLPKELSPVTGKIDNNTYALVFDQLELVNGRIDLWNYADFFNQDNPLKIMQGASTVCGIKKNMSKHPNKIKSHYRRVIAIGKLRDPFCVYLR